LRTAGFVPKVLENGTTVQVPSGDKDKIRADQRNALAAFVGFTTEPIGVQVSNATRKAQYMLRPSVGSDRRTADHEGDQSHVVAFPPTGGRRPTLAAFAVGVMSPCYENLMPGCLTFRSAFGPHRKVTITARQDVAPPGRG
jgi:hypothetical protein